ncbi:MAG: hypothetical protein ACK5XE_10535 [Burkholderiales bacterium]
MKTLLFILVAGCFAFAIFSTLKQKSLLRRLREGHFGPFEVSSYDETAEGIVAFDLKQRKVALLGVRVPVFHGKYTVTHHITMNIFFGFEQIDKIAVGQPGQMSAGTAVFRFREEVPPGNLDKALWVNGNAGILPKLIQQTFPPDLIL